MIIFRKKCEPYAEKEEIPHKRTILWPLFWLHRFWLPNHISFVWAVHQKELLPAEYFCFQKAQKIAHFNALPHTQFCTILFYAVVIPWVMERPQLMQMHCISITTVVVVSGVPSSKTYLLLSCPWTKIMNTVFNWIKKILKSSNFALQNIKDFKQKWYFVLLC